MMMQRFRARYGVPAKFGMEVLYKGVPVRIIGPSYDEKHLMVVRVDDADQKLFLIHPTQHVEYPSPAVEGAAE